MSAKTKTTTAPRLPGMGNEALAAAMRELRRSNVTVPHESRRERGGRTYAKQTAIRQSIRDAESE